MFPFNAQINVSNTTIVMIKKIVRTITTGTEFFCYSFKVCMILITLKLKKNASRKQKAKIQLIPQSMEKHPQQVTRFSNSYNIRACF